MDDATMNQQTLPCLAAVRDEISERCRALNSRARIEDITTERVDDWTLRIGVACENGQRFHIDLDLLDLAIEGGFIEALTTVLQ